MSARVCHIPRLFAAACVISMAFFCLRQSSAIQAAKLEPQTQQTTDFNRQIRPLLSDNCYACHGPDEKQRKAKLRLDVRESALNGTVLVPGAAARSELYKRITADDPNQRMPLAKSGKRLTPQQIELIRLWIE